MTSLYGVGSLTAPIIWAEMGDCQRFKNADAAVRHTGLDITVWSSDAKRHATGHLVRQGPPALRWALFESAYIATRKTISDHGCYCSVRDRIGSNRAALSVARKLARRTHLLRDLGAPAWEQAA